MKPHDWYPDESRIGWKGGVDALRMIAGDLPLVAMEGVKRLTKITHRSFHGITARLRRGASRGA